MEFRYLKAFLSTAKHKSFSKAAMELNIAQSAISRQIKNLERSLGHSLIVRSSKKVVLTDLGKSLYLTSTKFAQETNSLLERDDRKVIRIGALHGLLENWLQNVLENYLKNSQKSLDILVGTVEELREALKKGEVDVIFSTENIQSELLTSLKVFNEQLIIISKSKIEKANIPNMRWIVYSDEDPLFKMFKKPSSLIIRVNSITAMVKLVKKGLGVAVVPDHVVSKYDNIEKTKVTKIKSPYIHMTTLNYAKYPKYLQEFVDVVNKHI